MHCFTRVFWQIYMFFLVWRYQKRLEHYQGMKGPFAGGTSPISKALRLSLRAVFLAIDPARRLYTLCERINPKLYAQGTMPSPAERL